MSRLWPNMSQAVGPWLIWLLAIIMLAGCAPDFAIYRARTVTLNEPEPGQPITVGIGDEMLRYGAFLQHDAIYLEQSVSVGLLVGYTLRKGYYLKKRVGASADLYLPFDGPEGGRIVPAALADPARWLQVSRTEPKLCAVTLYNVRVCGNNMPFRRLKKSRAEDGSFLMTLIYSGRVGDRINVGYREFSNTLAQPDYYNEVEYDLADGMIIGYRDAELEILDADNRSITFIVRQSFGPRRPARTGDIP